MNKFPIAFFASIKTNLPKAGESSGYTRGFGIPGKITLIAPIEWEISASGNIEGRMKLESGFYYTSISGNQPINTKELSAKILEFAGEAKIIIGAKLQYSVDFFKDVIKASVNIHGGFEIKAEVDKTLFNPSTEISTDAHACTLCIDGKVDKFAKVSFELTYHITKKRSGKPFDVTPLEYRAHLLYFYCSILNNPNSPFGGEMHFDIGKCPNKIYRTTFEPQNANGNTVSNATVTIKTVSVKNIIPGTQVSSGTGKYVDYLYPGQYVASASGGGITFNDKNFTVGENAQTVVILEKSSTTNSSSTTSTTTSTTNSSNTTTTTSGGTTEPPFETTPMIASQSGHTVALKADGTVWAWGYNGYGQLGDGTIIERYTPVQVIGLSNVISITAGSHHTVALKSDGTVWAWGYNGYGQLGDGTTIERHTPVQVVDLSNVISITAINYDTFALKSDGTVWAWGDNGYGQLGDGTNTRRYTPVQVISLTNVISIMPAGALKSDGTVWTWGNNNVGQLGDGTTTNRYTPVQVTSLLRL